MALIWSMLSIYNVLLYDLHISWWRHQMETFSALLAICARNSPVPGEFLAQRPVTRSFDVFFDLRLNKRLNKQSLVIWNAIVPIITSLLCSFIGLRTSISYSQHLPGDIIFTGHVGNSSDKYCETMHVRPVIGCVLVFGLHWFLNFLWLAYVFAEHVFFGMLRFHDTARKGNSRNTL